MSIHLDINQKQLTEDVKLHFLPAEIGTNVEAKVNDFFNIYTTNENTHLTNSLRGFPLDGIDFQVPSTLNGVVFQEAQRTSGESCGRLLKVTGTFKNFTYWNYDKVPSASDGIRQALEALLVVDELSKPVHAEDLKNQIDQELQAKIEENS
ncbi:uncharacterized protein LOC129945969 [Eupeodes corollae]|uniref:uncharacterized protein LOC129945969 n=1 Tax=Eupeodes corollae TaxID=290404 RepID=UPI0024936E1D|nr:uncharacterized protein LOC129945969 [Eupeodes corollae]